jgi:hypothetical protein
MVKKKRKYFKIKYFESTKTYKTHLLFEC